MVTTTDRSIWMVVVEAGEVRVGMRVMVMIAVRVRVQSVRVLVRGVARR
jgi:hypothetical protein